MNQREFDPDRVGDRLRLMAIRRKRPLSCVLELTYRCNFHCRMCYIRMTDDQAAPHGRLRTVEEWLDMARQLREAGVLYITLTGGECTWYPGFERLYEELCRMGFRVSMLSNAGAYTDSIRDVFRRYPPYGVFVSLYGGSSETYRVVTGDPQGLEKTLENIRFLLSLRVPVQVNFTMIRQNVLDYPKVAGLCKELGVTYTLLTDITAHEWDPAMSDALQSRLSPAERALVACCRPHEIAEALAEAPALEKELEHFVQPTAPEGAVPVLPDACVASYSSCAIYWNGDMQTCAAMSGHHCVKPFEIGFEAAWAQLKADHANTFLRPAACVACPMARDCLHNCPARRYEGTGSPLEPDPYTCQYTYLLRLCRARRQGIDTPASPPCI